MDMDFSSEQKQLRDSARRFMEKEYPLAVVNALEKDPLGYSPKLWQDMADLGWTGLPLPEAHGGSAMQTVDVVLLTREFGRVMCPSPYIPTVLLAGGALSALGSEQQQERFLPGIVAGDTILGFALQERGGGFGPGSVCTTAEASADGGFVLNGEKRFVEFGASAKRILVVARTGAAGADGTGGLGLFIVDPKAAGVTLKPIAGTMANDRQCQLLLQDVKIARDDVVGTPGQVWSALEPVVQRAVVAFSAQMLGALERALDLAVDYAKQRVQFGKPIGSFMSIQHYLAQIAVDIVAVETLVYYAAWNLDQGNPARAEVARTKLAAGNALQDGTMKCSEVYGGMGFVAEVDVAYYLRRGKQWQLSMGDSRFWEDQLVAAITSVNEGEGAYA